MHQLIYNAQTGETTQIEVPDEPIEQLEPIPQEPTLEERVATTETKVASIEEVMEVIYG